MPKVAVPTIRRIASAYVTPRAAGNFRERGGIGRGLWGRAVRRNHAGVKKHQVGCCTPRSS